MSVPPHPDTRSSTVVFVPNTTGPEVPPPIHPDNHSSGAFLVPNTVGSELSPHLPGHGSEYSFSHAHHDWTRSVPHAHGSEFSFSRGQDNWTRSVPPPPAADSSVVSLVPNTLDPEVLSCILNDLLRPHELSIVGYIFEMLIGACADTMCQPTIDTGAG